MIIVSHRGNLVGPDPETENLPKQIDKAILNGFHVEVDVWYMNNEYYTGHDEPQYEIERDYLFLRRHNLFLHCKNPEALSQMQSQGLNCFWHETDKHTITSGGYIWSYPGQDEIEGAPQIIVHLEGPDVNSPKPRGICTDYPVKWKHNAH